MYTKIDKKIQDFDRLHGFAGWSTSSMFTVHKIKKFTQKKRKKNAQGRIRSWTG